MSEFFCFKKKKKKETWRENTRKVNEIISSIGSQMSFNVNCRSHGNKIFPTIMQFQIQTTRNIFNSFSKRLQITKKRKKKKSKSLPMNCYCCILRTIFETFFRQGKQRRSNQSETFIINQTDQRIAKIWMFR